jgi:hypothetical protein
LILVCRFVFARIEQKYNASDEENGEARPGKAETEAE